MAQIITVRTGGRGRPLTIDVESTLKQFMQQLPRAKARLQEIRRTTSGERAESILGSETTLPKGINATIDVLEALQQGQKIDYATARELRANLLTVRELASKQERVYGRALASQLVKQYEQDIAYQSKYASKGVASTYKGMLERVKTLTPRQQQKFFTSRGYQNVKTNRRDYKRVIEWAESDIQNKYGQDVQLTAEEAFAYMLEDRQIKAIEAIKAE